MQSDHFDLNHLLTQSIDDDDNLKDFSRLVNENNSSNSNVFLRIIYLVPILILSMISIKKKRQALSKSQKG